MGIIWFLLKKLFDYENEPEHKNVEEKKDEKTPKYEDYFDEQNIRCNSDVDRAAIQKVYNALVIDNYDTSDDNNLTDAMQTLDSNVYNLCKAIIYQNFMTMRKVDAIRDDVKNIYTGMTEIKDIIKKLENENEKNDNVSTDEIMIDIKMMTEKIDQINSYIRRKKCIFCGNEQFDELGHCIRCGRISMMEG